MQLRHSWLISVLLIGLGVGCRSRGAEPTGPGQPVRVPQAEVTVTGVGFATPESVLYDSRAELYLVANINGSPLVADDNGFVSRVAADGKVMALKWIDGASDGVVLNAPKGMALVEETLYVADISSVRLFDRTTGTPTGSIDVAGATFLNDLVSAPDGTVYVSDSGLKAGPQGAMPAENDAIYRLRSDGTYEVVLKSVSLGHPNGLAWRGESLVVVTFGTGEVYTLTTDGMREALPTPQSGSLDGVVVLEDGRLLISSWEGKCVYALDAQGHYTRLVTNVTSPADIGYDSQNRNLLIPIFSEDAVRIVPLP